MKTDNSFLSIHHEDGRERCLEQLFVYIYSLHKGEWTSYVGSSVGSEFRFLVVIKLADGVTSLSLSSARSLVSARDIPSS